MLRISSPVRVSKETWVGGQGEKDVNRKESPSVLFGEGKGTANESQNFW